MKKGIVIFLVMILPLLCLIGLDFLNVTKYFPITKNYDWLSFLGSYITGLCTFILVSYLSNKTKVFQI